MKEKYGKEWKRILGIDIAYYDYQNANLEHPILFVEGLENISFLDKHYSKSCPNQGFFTPKMRKNGMNNNR